MFYKNLSFLFFSFFSVALFGHNIQKEKERVLLENLNAVHKIIVYAPEAIKNYENGKLYLNEDRIFQMNLGSSLSLYNGEVLSLSFMSSDSIGPYLITMGVAGINNKKFFKNVTRSWLTKFCSL